MLVLGVACNIPLYNIVYVFRYCTYNHSILTANGTGHSITTICLTFLLSAVRRVFASCCSVSTRCAENYWPGHAKNRNDIVRGGISGDNGRRRRMESNKKIRIKANTTAEKDTPTIARAHILRLAKTDATAAVAAVWIRSDQ